MCQQSMIDSPKFINKKSARFIKDAIKTLKENGHSFVYFEWQKDEVIRQVPEATAEYVDEAYYKLTLRRK